MLAWYKADAGTGGSSDADPVTSWTDQSGNGHTVSNTGGTVRPLYKTNRQNGLPSVLFDGSNDYLASAAITPVGTVAEVWLVVKIVAFSNSARVFNTSGDSGVSTGLTLRQGGAAPELALDAVTGSSVQYLKALPIGAFGILRCVGNGASSSLALNNNAYTAIGDISAETPIRGITFGRATAVFNYGNIEIGEALFYTRILAEAEAQANWSYLNGRWRVF